MRSTYARFRQRRDVLCRQTKDTNGTGDVFDRVLAKIGEGQPQLIANLFVGGPRNTYAAGLAKRLEASSDIDAIAEDVVTVNNNIADVHSDAKDNLFGCGHRSIPCQHALLDRHRASRKFEEQPVTGSLDESPTAYLDGRV